MISGRPKHPQAHQREADAFHKGRTRPDPNGCTDDREAETVGRRVAQKVESIGLQRLRAGECAGSYFHQEHPGVDRNDDPKPPLVISRQAFEGGAFSATGYAHVQSPTLPEVSSATSPRQVALVELTSHGVLRIDNVGDLEMRCLA